MFKYIEYEQIYRQAFSTIKCTSLVYLTDY